MSVIEMGWYWKVLPGGLEDFGNWVLGVGLSGLVGTARLPVDQGTVYHEVLLLKTHKITIQSDPEYTRPEASNAVILIRFIQINVILAV